MNKTGLNERLFLLFERNVHHAKFSLCVCMTDCLFYCLFVCLPVRLSTDMYVCMSVCPSVCPFVLSLNVLAIDLNKFYTVA